MAFKRSGVRLPLSPPKRNGLQRQSVFFLVKWADEIPCARCPLKRKPPLGSEPASGAHLARPVQGNAEDGVWVQTPRRASRGSPPKRNGLQRQSVFFLVKWADEIPCARCPLKRKPPLGSEPASGAHLARPVQGNAEDGVWVQTPRRASRGSPPKRKRTAKAVRFFFW